MVARFIEHRRHSMRTKPGQHLSQAGVDLARRVGARNCDAFDKVYTSHGPSRIRNQHCHGICS